MCRIPWPCICCFHHWPLYLAPPSTSISGRSSSSISISLLSTALAGPGDSPPLQLCSSVECCVPLALGLTLPLLLAPPELLRSCAAKRAFIFLSFAILSSCGATKGTKGDRSSGPAVATWQCGERRAAANGVEPFAGAAMADAGRGEPKEDAGAEDAALAPLTRSESALFSLPSLRHESASWRLRSNKFCASWSFARNLFSNLVAFSGGK
mmetsp:Transcript_116065/g.248219  ORF Transcript_116065/g.248219 Transcript_116065/m.248219 type:complete len:210 (-) Transcript_116065:247-876(-)